MRGKNSIAVGTVVYAELLKRAADSGRKVDGDLLDDVIIMGLEVYDFFRQQRSPGHIQAAGYFVGRSGPLTAEHNNGREVIKSGKN